MSNFMVTSSQLMAKADDLSNLNTQLKQNTTALGETEANLINMWEGDAKTAFHTVFSRDKVQMDNFYNAIAQYVEVLRTIAAKYAEVESQNADIATTRTY